MKNLKTLRISSDYLAAEATFQSLLSEAIQYANGSDASNSSSPFMVKIKAAYSAGCALRDVARVVVEAAWEIYEEAIAETKNEKRSWFYNWIVGYKDEKKSALATYHALKDEFDCIDKALIEINNTINEMHNAATSRSESEKDIGKAISFETRDFSFKFERITHCFNCKSILTSSVNNKCFSCNWLKCQCGSCGCNFGRFYS